MAGIPPPSPSDPDDVVWALQTAATQWERGDRRDAAAWLQRAARAAAAAGDDDRAFALGRDAAELLDTIGPPAAQAPELSHEQASDDAMPLSSAIAIAVTIDDEGDVAEVQPEEDDDVVTSAPPMALIDRPTGSDARLRDFRSARAFIGVRDAKPFIDTIEREAETAPPKLRRRPPPPPPRFVPKPPVSAPSAEASIPEARPAPPQAESSRAADSPAAANGESAAEPSLEPISLEPLSLEPISLEPLSTEPRSESAGADAQRYHDAAQAPSGADTVPPPADVNELPGRPADSSPGATGAVPTADRVGGAADEARDATQSTAEPARAVSVAAAAQAGPLDAEPSPQERPAHAATLAAAEPPRRSTKPPDPSSRLVSLAPYDAFSDIPDDELASFESHAEVQRVGRDEEVSGFGLVLVVDGEFQVNALVSDVPATKLGAGSVLRARGTVPGAVDVRLACASPVGIVATWSQEVVEESLGALPWVEEELQSRANKVHALVGATLGPLGEELDGGLLAELACHMTVRVLLDGEELVAQGSEMPGLVVVGLGGLERITDAGADRLAPGDFVFPSALLEGTAAPATVRAADGGAVVLVVDRAVAQELFMTFPPLLDLLLRL